MIDCKECGERVEALPIHKCKKVVVTDNSALLTVLKKLRKKTNHGAGGGRLGEWFQGYDKAMAEMRIELNRIIKENS